MDLLAKGVGVEYGRLGHYAPAPADHDKADLFLNKHVQRCDLLVRRWRFLVRFRALR